MDIPNHVDHPLRAVDPHSFRESVWVFRTLKETTLRSEPTPSSELKPRRRASRPASFSFATRPSRVASASAPGSPSPRHAGPGGALLLVAGLVGAMDSEVEEPLWGRTPRVQTPRGLGGEGCGER